MGKLSYVFDLDSFSNLVYIIKNLNIDIYVKYVQKNSLSLSLWAPFKIM
jgi:hypothetical protein